MEAVIQPSKPIYITHLMPFSHSAPQPPSRTAPLHVPPLPTPAAIAHSSLTCSTPTLPCRHRAQHPYMFHPYPPLPPSRTEPLHAPTLPSPAAIAHSTLKCSTPTHPCRHRAQHPYMLHRYPPLCALSLTARPLTQGSCPNPPLIHTSPPSKSLLQPFSQKHTPAIPLKACTGQSPNCSHWPVSHNHTQMRATACDPAASTHL